MGGDLEDFNQYHYFSTEGAADTTDNYPFQLLALR